MGGLSPLVPSSRERPPGNSDGVLRAHPAHPAVHRALLPKPHLLPLPQVFPVPDASGRGQKTMELWGTRRHQGVAWGTGAEGRQRSPSPHSQNHSSSQLCCCGAHKKEGPVRQPLGCLTDGQEVTLPVVSEGLGLGRGLSSLAWRHMEEGDSWGPSGRREESGGVGNAELQCGAKEGVRRPN